MVAVIGAVIGNRPWRWKAERRAYLESTASRATEARLDALEDSLNTQRYSPYEQGVVKEEIEASVQEVTEAGLNHAVAQVVTTQLAEVLSVAAAYLVAPLLTWFLLPSDLAWGWIVAGAVASGVLFFGAMQLFKLVASLMRFRRPWAGMFIPLLILSVAAWPDRMIPSGWWLHGSLSTPWLHAILVSAAWTLAGYAALFGLLIGATSLARLGFSRRLRRMPHCHMQYDLATLVLDLMSAPGVAGSGSQLEARRDHVRVLEEIASSFERNWPRATQVRAKTVRNAQRAYAAAVATKVRELQSGILQQHHKPLNEFGLELGTILIDLILKAHELDPSAHTGGRGRAELSRVLRMSWALLLIICSAALVGAVLLVPNLPLHTEKWGLPLATFLVTVAVQLFPSQPVTTRLEHVEPK